jgi:hypothetical protein
MKAAEGFAGFCESLVGTWIGRRSGGELENEVVRSRWQISFAGAFLHERWETAGRGDSPLPTAEAFFKVSASGPGDFIAVYQKGEFAFGESSFAGGEWRLTHRWLRKPGVAEIRLKFLDPDAYEQEVLEVATDGRLIPESKAVMKRERARRRQIQSVEHGGRCLLFCN